MTGTEIIRLQNYFLRKMDNYAGRAPTPAQSLAQVNWALRTIGRKIFMYDPLVVFTPITDTRRYNLRNSSVFAKPIVKPYVVTIGGNLLYEASGQEPGMWSLAELMRWYPNWQTSGSGTPFLACFYGNNELVLESPPSAAAVALGSHYVGAQILPADLASVSETPIIPADLHEAIAYLAAVRAALPGVSEKAAFMRLDGFSAEWREAVEQEEQQNRDAISAWGSTPGSHFDDLLMS